MQLRAQLQYAVTSSRKFRCSLAASGQEKNHKADDCPDTVQEEGPSRLSKNYDAARCSTCNRPKASRFTALSQANFGSDVFLHFFLVL